VILEHAPAKINLTLQVSAPIPEGEPYAGYHRLGSLVAFASRAGDRLTFEPADSLDLAVEGPFAGGLGGPASDNLVLRAARRLQDAAGISNGASIVLHKNLPVASGIGGGSSDAAATLRGLVRLWGLDLSRNDLRTLATGLGADVPACLDPVPQWMSGIGDQTSPVLIDDMPALLVNPGVACPTPAVYAAFDRMLRDGQARAGDLAVLETSDRYTVLAAIGAHGNSLQTPAVALLPEIGLVLDVLSSQRGVQAAAMSGSGATCFAVFATLEQAEAASSQVRAMLNEALPDLWCAPTLLGAAV
jgi:4-diphosphocytidyl-2-C-methyl-D-erythritol kinase